MVQRARAHRERKRYSPLRDSLLSRKTGKKLARARARARTKPKNRVVKSKTHHFLRGCSRRRAQRHRRRDDRRDRFPRDGGDDDGLIIFVAFEGGFGKSSVLWVSSPIKCNTRFLSSSSRGVAVLKRVDICGISRLMMMMMKTFPYL